MTHSNIKPFLDDFARISLRHGFKLSEGVGGIYIDRITSDFDGYSVRVRDGVSDGFPLHDHLMFASDYVDSIDLTKLSNHERIKIHGTQSPDLAQMLRDAYKQGARDAGQAWDGEWPFHEGFEDDLFGDEYAAKIIGGQG
tara:strand:- start:2588 stop:3007 length:420 start_codon:yes stop_codon:yes gene_type:complete